MSSSIPRFSPISSSYYFEDQTCLSVPSLETTLAQCQEEALPLFSGTKDIVTNSDAFTLFDLTENHFDWLAISPFEETPATQRLELSPALCQQVSPTPFEWEVQPIFSEENDSLSDTSETRNELLAASSDVMSPLSLDEEPYGYALQSSMHSPEDHAIQISKSHTIPLPPSLDGESTIPPSTDTQKQTVSSKTATMPVMSGSILERRGKKRKKRSVVPLASVSNEPTSNSNYLTSLCGRYIFQYIEELVQKNRCHHLFDRVIPSIELNNDFQKWVREKKLVSIRGLIADNGKVVAGAHHNITKILPHANIRLIFLEESYYIEINREKCLEGIKKTKQFLKDYDSDVSKCPVARYISRSLRPRGLSDWNFGRWMLVGSLYEKFQVWNLRTKKGRRSPEDFRRQFHRWLPCPVSVFDKKTFFSIPSLENCKEIFEKTKLSNEKS